ncbi:MAG: hypothetical protein ACOYI4_04165 [Christensenellales bacterium]|jgi:hypothetical protein
MRFAYHRLPSHNPGFFRERSGFVPPATPVYRPTTDLLLSLLFAKYREQEAPGAVYRYDNRQENGYTVIPLEKQREDGESEEDMDGRAETGRDMTPMQRQRAMLSSMKKYCDNKSAERIGFMEGMLARFEAMKETIAETRRGKGEGMADHLQGMMEMAQGLGLSAGAEPWQRMMNMMRMIQAMNSMRTQQRTPDDGNVDDAASSAGNMALVSSLLSGMNGGGSGGMDGMGSLLSAMNGGGMPMNNMMGLLANMMGGNNGMGSMMGLLNRMNNKNAGGGLSMSNMMGMLANMMGGR